MSVTFEKYKDSEVRGRIVNHNNRKYKQNKNGNPIIPKHINTKKSNENYSIPLPHRKIKGFHIPPKPPLADYEYYEKRRDEVFRIQRKNIKTAIGAIVTPPNNLAPERYKDFFNKTFEFLYRRFGGVDGENIINATVHFDEMGINEQGTTKPHLHFAFLPIVPNPSKRGGKSEKLSAKDVIHKGSLFKFHREYREYLISVGLKDVAESMYTGITKAQGGSRTVAELKRATEAGRRISVERVQYGR